jgi:hypothetical protein
MEYRDERDALRGRVENLEQDLAAAREELARGGDDARERRIAELERQLADGRKLLDRLSTELEALRARPPKPADHADHARGTSFLQTDVGRILGFVGFSIAAVMASVIVPSTLRRTSSVSVPPATPRMAMKQLPPPPPVEQPKELPPEVRHVDAVWNATVTRATGRVLTPGSACRITATLEGPGATIGVGHVAVVCGGSVLYDSEAKLEGMSMSSSAAEERAGEVGGTFRYGLVFQDKGARSGARTEASINTPAGVAAAWSDSMPAFRVELAVRRQSEPVRGEALSTQRTP